MKNNKIIIIIGSIVGVIVLALIGFILTRPKYKCPDSSYKLKNKRCIKTEESSSYQKLICPEGMVVEGSHCVKITTKDASYTYQCPSGYSIVNQMCQKTLIEDTRYYYFCSGKRTEEKTCEKYKQPKTDYSTGRQYCEEGTLKGSNCVITSDSIRRKDCPTDYKKVGQKCQKVLSEAATLVYSCDSNYTLNDKVCEAREYQDGKWETACKEGFTLKGTKCIKNINIAATKK